ncbi:uncharacterized protein TM35_000132100 [Trypanosoma theileri]|uniref:SET domain-containing protein n=1 Tax=Trypanosoma theileri TaxID=67003 RepID=A0A1X0NWW3_9TRYP|nr:uncharacterized protein TM35_000132100 [Trypanosoma theileri]ORC89206.1 hypothetical protein TM35_000132100 [Trypanosoma theileri]
MDPADAAATYLTLTLEKMGVPCKVINTPEKGKHVVATADIPAQTDLFEETPIVSWPAQGYLALDIPFCSHCLRQQGRKSETDEKKEEEEAWHKCGCGSMFCSETCESTSKIAHCILCNNLRKLREDDDNKSLAAENKNSNKPITKESLARCVAWIIARIASTIKHQKFSGKMLEEDHKKQSETISRQIFQLATAPFNRLIDTPKGTIFSDVDAVAWYSEIDYLLREPCLTTLLEATVEPPCENNDWAKEIVDALLRRDTLETLLGQMTLNSQAVNGLVFSRPAEEKSSASTLPVEWVLKGGGMYTLQSAFNHSCLPNVVVTAVDGTHDIVLRTLRPIQNGEELTITYIPLENTREKRHELLKGYFFTCCCQRCEDEKKTE